MHEGEVTGHQMVKVGRPQSEYSIGIVPLVKQVGAHPDAPVARHLTLMPRGGRH